MRLSGYLIAHSVYGLGKVSMYHRAPVVAGVSRDKRSVSTSTTSIYVVRKEAGDADWMML